MNKKILIIAAHPDDEVLGCGGTIAKHLNDGDSINVAFLSDGVKSRNNTNSIDVEKRKLDSISAGKILGSLEPPIFLNFPDNRMDSVDLLDIVQAIENIIISVDPVVIYTHHSGDLNIDHQLTHKALLTAARPLPDSNIKEIYTFEVQSSTEWSPSAAFYPNYFVDISATLDKKLSAMKKYDSEIQDFPHPRSLESINALAKYRGSCVGLKAAEAFKVARLIY
jgi:N-acetylglucosamine malate deacetylase 1